MVRPTGIGTRNAGARRPVALVLALLLVAGALPARAAQAAPLHFRNDGDLFRLHGAELPRALAALAAAPGFATARLERARLPRGPRALRAEEMLDGLRPVGSDELARLEARGETAVWDEVIDVLFASDGERLSTAYSVEGDEIRIAVPFDPAAPGSRIGFSIADVEVEVPVADLVSGTLPASTGAALEDAFSRLRDPQRLAAAVAAFDAALASMLGRPDEGFSPDASGWSCVTCGALLVAYGSSLAALVAACGGPLAMPCVLAFLNLSVGKAMLLAACAQCVEWIEEQRLKKVEVKETKAEPWSGDCFCQGLPLCDCG